MWFVWHLRITCKFEPKNVLHLHQWVFVYLSSQLTHNTFNSNFKDQSLKHLYHLPTCNHMEQCGVHRIAQGHFDTCSGNARTDPAIFRSEVKVVLLHHNHPNLIGSNCRSGIFFIVSLSSNVEADMKCQTWDSPISCYSTESMMFIFSSFTFEWQNQSGCFWIGVYIITTFKLFFCQRSHYRV